MPTYDYQCRTCDTVFEVRHGFDEKPPKTCKAQNCRGKLERLFSPPAIIFKGKGWHVNDYGRGNGNGKDNSRSKGSAPDKLGKTMEKNSDKPADKPADKPVKKSTEKTTATAAAKD